MRPSFGKPLRESALGFGLAILTVTASGCDSLLGSDRAAFANNARVIVEGTSTVPLQLVTSTNFTARRDFETGDLVASLILADTAVVPALPDERNFTIRGADRFLVRLVNPDSTVTATIHIRVLLDDRTVFNQRATMRDASLEYIAFYDPS